MLPAECSFSRMHSFGSASLSTEFYSAPLVLTSLALSVILKLVEP